MKTKTLLTFITTFLCFVVSSQLSTSHQSFQIYGYDDQNMSLTIDNPSSFTVNEEQPITQLTISGFSVVYCIYTTYSLVLDGITVLSNSCQNAFIGQDVTNASSIVVLITDNDNDSDFFNLHLTFEVTYETPTCVAPTNGQVNLLTTSSATISWTPVGNEEQWNVSWGYDGFSSGNELGSQLMSTPSISIPDLSENTNYELKITAACNTEESYPLFVKFMTNCNTYTTGFCESFGNDSPTLGCWKILDNNNPNVEFDFHGFTSYKWVIANQSAFFYNNYLINYNDDYLISPPLFLTGNEFLKFSFLQGSYLSVPGGLKVLISTTGTEPSDFTELEYVLHTNTQPKTATINLSAYAGNVYIAFYAGSSIQSVAIKDVCIDYCPTDIGPQVNFDVCSNLSFIDLNDYVPPIYPDGSWVSETLQNNIYASDFTLSSTITEGTYTLYYISNTGCRIDTTTAFMTVVDPLHAGNDKSITACNNESINLENLLNGNFDSGGIWYGPNNELLFSPIIQTMNSAYQTTYRYVVNNGVCNADTAAITLNVNMCYLNIEEKKLETISLSPNPNNGLFQITGLPAGNDFSVEITDVNGRIVSNNVVATNTTMNVDLTYVETGVYLVKISGLESNKIIRVVKQ